MMPPFQAREAGISCQIQGERHKMAALLITFAVKEESRPFQNLISSRPDLRVRLTGIGHRNAEKAIRNALAESSPKLVLTCGFAGGLNPELAAGTVVFSVNEKRPGDVNPPPPPREGSQTSDARGQFSSREGVDAEAQIFGTQPDRLATVLLAAGARQAKFHCADRVAVSAEEKYALWRSTGADAVEMESDIIRFVCREHRIPCATVRVISDAAGEDLPLDFNRLIDAGQNLSYSKLTAALLKSPGKIGALLELQKQTQAAADKLAQVLVKVLANVPC